MQQNINTLKAIFMFLSSLAHISITDSEITSFQFFTAEITLANPLWPW